jgi:multisubunit Na+/H+ antiporter MnhB subunit
MSSDTKESIMRALCGSIITAGALIGLGLTALGFGTRFQAVAERHAEGAFHGSYYGAPSMTIALVVLLIAVFVGLAVAFIGLAYHHERRHREWQSSVDNGHPSTPRERVGV